MNRSHPKHRLRHEQQAMFLQADAAFFFSEKEIPLFGSLFEKTCKKPKKLLQNPLTK